MRSVPIKLFYALLSLSLMFALTGIQPVYAAGIVVTSSADNTNDDGQCTLREAVTNANNDAATEPDCTAGSGDDLITFNLTGCPCTITLSMGYINIYTNMTITGLGASNLAISGGSASRVIYLGTATLYLSHLTITGGSAPASQGGGILIGNNSVLYVSQSVISGNSAQSGGGIYSNAGTATFLNSAISNNTASGDGGGIYGNGPATTTITNSTITGNSTAGVGMAIVSGGTVTIRNSTIANNTAGGGTSPIYNVGTMTLWNTIVANSNCNAAVTNGGNNIDSGTTCGFGSANGSQSSTNPLLGALTGSPAYFPISSSSPAFDAGDDTICAAAPVSSASQNGVIRPQGGHCDIGSFEFAPFSSVSKWSSSFDLSHGWTVADYVRTVGDVNNDGRDDLIGFGSDGVYVVLSNGTGFGAISKWSSSFDLSHGWTVADYVRTVGDVNNDGRDDLIGFGLDGVYVALSNGTSFDAVSKWSSSFDLSHGWTVASYVRTVGDVNNDGRDDLIGFGLDGVYVALSNGASFDAISKWSSSFDLSHGWTVASYVRTVGDVNNDGRDDLIGFGSDGVYVALSNGASFDAISKWSSSFDLSHGWTVASYVRTAGDVNNDGRDDLVGFGSDGVYIALSNGTGFGSIGKWSSSFDLSHGWTVADYVRTVGDVNNDGKADLVGFGLDGVYVATAQ